METHRDTFLQVNTFSIALMCRWQCVMGKNESIVVKEGQVSDVIQAVDTGRNQRGMGGHDPPVLPIHCCQLRGFNHFTKTCN